MAIEKIKELINKYSDYDVNVRLCAYSSNKYIESKKEFSDYSLRINTSLDL